MKRLRLDIRDWEAFTTLVRIRHFGHAAEELGITQSALSQRISKLESDLQFRILTRSNQGVAPTDEGLALLPEARALIAAKRNALEAAAAIREEGARPMRVLLSNAIIHSDLIPKLRKALDKEGKPEVQVEVAAADEIEARLQSREHDLAITTLPMTKNGFEECLLEELPMAVAVPEELDRQSVSMECLCQQEVITVARVIEPELYDRLILEASSSHQDLKLGPSVVSFPSILAMVSMGKGWGIVPLAMADATPYGIKILPLDMPSPPTIRVFVAWQSENHRAREMAETFLENCR